MSGFPSGRDAAPPRFETLFKPWARNPLRGRADVERALRALTEPVEAFRSPGGARIRLGAGGAHFDEAAAELEGYSRLLWGLAPAQVGGADWIDWARIRRGLANGCDETHPEFWGWPKDKDQRLVEMAAIGFALRLVPEEIWTPLAPEEKARAAAWLRFGHERAYGENNWKFFRLLISMGLRHVGEACDPELDREAREALDSYALGGGWFQDGRVRRADHYIPFAFHYYGPLIAKLDDRPQGNGLWAQAYLDHAARIAPDVAHWFSQDGAALCFGRSMTYRFAIAGFFGALGLAGLEALPWGAQKGLYLRHLRWWAKRPFAGRDGILNVGYGYENLLPSEPYNSPQSPYWAMKAFLPLMLPEEHPFWSSEEQDWSDGGISVQPQPGFLLGHPRGDAVALSSGQDVSAQNPYIRFGAEKYAKFAYSARYGFSIESDPRRFESALLDNMLGFSADGLVFVPRETNEEVLFAEDALYALWRPWPDVKVETWLYWEGEFQIRRHRIETPRALQTAEGGTAVPRGSALEMRAEAGLARVSTAEDVSLIWDLAPGAQRLGRCQIAAPNTNLIAARTIVPQLRGEIGPGRSEFVSAVFAAPLSEGPAPDRRPVPREFLALEARLKEKGLRPGVMRSPPG